MAIPDKQINDTSVHNSDAFSVCMAQKMTGLTNGDTWDFVWINCFNAAGNVRLKVYKDDGSGGDPSTLLAETGSTVLVSGWNKISCSFTVPASGNVWLAYEFDTGTASFYGTSGSCNAKYVVHTYGTGPSPFGATSCNNTAYNMGISRTAKQQAVSDTLSTVESVTKLIAKSISDSISLSGEKVNKSINKTISDTLGLTDSVRVVPSTIRLSDNILTTDTVSISKNIIRSVVDNLSAGDIISKSLGKQINDSPSLSDVLSKNINKILTDNLSLVDIISKDITKLIVENPSFLDSTGQSRTLIRQITDALSILESIVISKSITEQIIDNLSSGDSISKNIGKLLQDNPILAEQLSKAIGKIITDNISIPDSVTKNIGSLLLNQTRRINLNNTTQQMISEGKPRNVTI